nr:hypothetical protein [Tanacetum cinerariifolium]
MSGRYEVKKKDITKGKEIDVGDNVNLKKNGKDVVKNNAGRGKSKEMIMKEDPVVGKTTEQSSRSSTLTGEMIDFQECVNNIELDDLHCEGFYYTWTKSFKNPQCRTLKKLDRIMVKAESYRNLEEYQEAIKEEYSLSCQKAKVKWLKEGDKNIDYFYKTIKERAHKGRILTIRIDEGIKFENEDVAKQIALMMVRQVSDAEYKNAMFEIDDSKAPGQDGYTARFYKSTWSIVGKEVILAIREFFDTEKLLGEVNATLILLVLKIRNPDKIKRGTCWEFLKETLMVFGFHEIMVGWIMKCIITTKFSSISMGKELDTLEEDHISSCLFTLVMEVLTLLIKKNIEEESKFKYHQGCKKCKITHLCFADDLLVFCHGDRDSVRVIKKSLDEFNSFSGLLPNMQKSTISFGGLLNLEQAMILDIIPFTIGRLPVKYLRAPLVTKQISSNDCKPLIEKVKSKISNWKNKSLSYAGRLQLIAAILSYMQIY